MGRGEMAEWSKATVLKTVRPEMVSGVRIPLSPPLNFSTPYTKPLLITLQETSLDSSVGRSNIPKVENKRNFFDVTFGSGSSKTVSSSASFAFHF